MSENKKRLREFAGIVEKQLAPLKQSEKFREKFEEISIKLCINPIDGRYASIVIIDKGTISFDGIKNSPKENISKKNLKWDGRVMMSTKKFLKLIKGELSTEKIIVNLLSRKIKVRGTKNVLLLLKAFRIRKKM